MYIYALCEFNYGYEGQFYLRNDEFGNTWQTWQKPRGCKFVYMLVIGGGAGGGGGQSGTGVGRTGGGGGGSSGMNK